MIALYYVIFLTLVAIFAPMIVGTKPILCKYKGRIYAPCLAYFNSKWEPAIFIKDLIRNNPRRIQEKDPESWAIWPLIYQDPYRRVRDKEWPNIPGSPSGEEGHPNRFNLLGTNREGVDVLAQLVHGTTVALLVGFVSMGIATLIGVVIGALSGYFGGKVDMVLSRLVEVVMCLPMLILILAAVALIEKRTIWHVMVIIGLTNWTTIARLTRAEFMKLRQAEFVTAARAMGLSEFRIMFRHILPNATAPILVPITFGISSAILLESALSFLGVGQSPPNPSWGTLLDAGRDLQLWWLVLFPGIAIFLAVLAYNLIGEGLQEATDPRLRDPGK